MTELNKQTQDTQLRQTAVKCRFFAQYFGVRVFQNEANKPHNLPNYSYPLSLQKNFTHSLYEYLELKPLSKATREELLDTYHKMWEFNEDLIESDIKLALDWFGNYGTQNYVKFNQQQTDFLRSKGYAIPFMEYSVNDLVSFGWVRLL